MPISKPLVTATLLWALTTSSACTSREYVTKTVLREIRPSDPQLKKLRVYPNVTLITVYERTLGQDTGVSGSAGTVEAGFRGKRIEVPVRRKLPGAVVKLEAYEGEPLLWVTFDERCVEVECSYGFIRNSDGLFRLFKVPELTGYREAEVFRRRISGRKRMEKSKLYAKDDAAATFRTVRGYSLSVGLEIKKRENVDIETIEAPKKGVRPGL